MGKGKRSKKHQQLNTSPAFMNFQAIAFSFYPA
jgi:hypothetical protein